MDKAVSISVRDVTKAAQATVKKVLADHKKTFPKKPDFRVGFFPPHYWFGFVMEPTPEVLQAPLSELTSVAVEIKRFTADKVGDAAGGRPGVMLNDGLITVGFAPPIDVNLIEG
ncbi:hypothetical protein JQ604_22195 [Bradyrhizobium jicamae]|uniref:hypothetical protein n=1 Tax=Bradyrhizobium jicamae TaxID=280332 RepID=UPI001BAD0CF4|nr:hypothetical protein [Bradyrhizobium jicamae]MBR0754903.1 hypothetical protein [Bradyrhizobium jicamae]